MREIVLYALAEKGRCGIKDLLSDFVATALFNFKNWHLVADFILAAFKAYYFMNEYLNS